MAVLQARVFSARLPGKVLEPLIGRTMLSRIAERIRRAETIDCLVVATGSHPGDDPIQNLCQYEELCCFRGSVNDVLDRFYRCALHYEAKHIIRFTCDCPFLDPGVVDQIVKYHIRGGYEYTSNVVRRTFPDGLDTEVMTIDALAKVWCKAGRRDQREHPTRFILEHPEKFNIGSFETKNSAFEKRWTVDTPEDLAFARTVYRELYSGNPEFTWADILRLLDAHPEIESINASCGYDRAARGPCRLDG